MILAPVSDQVEHRQTVLVAGDCFAVDDALTRWQSGDGRSRQLEAVREVVAVAGNQSDAAGIATGQDTKPVVLDFVNPVWS